MTEIERKFLVGETPRAESGSTAIEQGYLAADGEAEVRLRRFGGELLLTAKTGSGEVREEVEVSIAPRAFEALWPLTAGRRVRKVRHYVPLGDGLRAELDIYTGKLDGLLTVEVEFDSPAAAADFEPPAWMGREVTGDERYSNRTLASAGLPPGARKRDDSAVKPDANDGARRGASPSADDAGWGADATDDAPGGAGSVTDLFDPAAPAAPDRAYKLRADEDPAEGMRRVIAGRIDKAAERLGEADDGDALAEAIHGARKDLKKARAALRMIREELGEKAFKRENRALRDAGRLLSASRDAEVKLATLDALASGETSASTTEGTGAPLGGAIAPPGAVALWREALLADRDRILGDGDGTRADGATSAATSALEAVAARIPGWRIRRADWKLLAPGLDTAYREGRGQFLALGAEPDFEGVHELRKRGKDLWYQLRLLSGAWPEVLGATAGEIHDFTDRLGDHHDLAVLAADLRERDEIHFADRETLEGLIEARQAGLLADARDLGARIYAEKPKAFGGRMRALWRAWRISP